MKKSMKSFGTAAVALGAIVAAQSASAEGRTFAIVTAGLSSSYQTAMAKQFTDVVEAAGDTVVVIDAQFNPELQANAIDDLIQQGVAGVGIQPLDSVAGMGWVDRLNEAGIPVVAGGSIIGEFDEAPTYVYPGLTALVVTDDIEVGRLSGKLAADNLPKDKTVKIGVVSGMAGNPVVEHRLNGFKKGLEENGIKYEIVVNQPTTWTPEDGQALCQDYVTAYPDIDMIYSEAPPMTVGCARALAAVSSQVKLISTAGGQIDENNEIEDGNVFGTVCTFPGTQGKIMAEILVAAAADPNYGRGHFATYDIFPVTKENVGDCVAQW